MPLIPFFLIVFELYAFYNRALQVYKELGSELGFLQSVWAWCTLRGSRVWLGAISNCPREMSIPPGHVLIMDRYGSISCLCLVEGYATAARSEV